jgi:hypothetical protein
MFRVGRSLELDTFSAMVVTFQTRSIVRVSRVPFSISDYVSRSVTFHGTLIMEERVRAAFVRVFSLLLTAFLVKCVLY